MSAPDVSPPRLSCRLVPLIACLLLLIFAVLALHSAREASITFDEPEQVALGYLSLTEPGHGYSVINLRLSQIWEALPLLFFKPRPHFPSMEERAHATERNISYGKLFFFSGGRDAQEMLFACRAMVVVLGVVLGALIFWQSRRLHGDLAGLLSLALYAFCPLVIAHSSLATTDIATALLFSLATLALWRLIEKPGLQTILWAGLAVGVLAATKISSVLIVPITLLLVGAKALERVGARRDFEPWPVFFRNTALALFGASLLAWGVVWLVYGGPLAAPPVAPQPWATHPTVEGHFANRLISLARSWRLLPEAYLFDLHQFVHSGEIRRAYLLGQYSLDGWWYYFPLAWLVKNPLPLLFAVPAAAFAAWRLRRAPQGPDAVNWRGLTPWIVLAVVYGGFAITGNLNIGARHLLPLYPSALIFAGLAAKLLSAERRTPVLLVCALAGGAAFETALAHPHHLAYFNALVGGSSKGYRIMVDSSTDWGESLLAVRRWLDRREGNRSEESSKRPVYLSCFAHTDLGYYGLGEPRVSGLPQYYDARPIRPYPLLPGTYIISATMLQCVYNGRFMGPWRPRYEKLYQERLQDMAVLGPALRSQAALDALFKRDGLAGWLSKISDFDYLRFSRLCAYLRQRSPDDQITPSMLVYEVTLQDLEAALAGEPAELHPDGAIKGAERFSDEDLDFLK